VDEKEEAVENNIEEVARDLSGDGILPEFHIEYKEHSDSFILVSENVSDEDSSSQEAIEDTEPEEVDTSDNSTLHQEDYIFVTEVPISDGEGDWDIDTEGDSSGSNEDELKDEVETELPDKDKDTGSGDIDQEEDADEVFHDPSPVSGTVSDTNEVETIVTGSGTFHPHVQESSPGSLTKVQPAPPSVKSSCYSSKVPWILVPFLLYTVTL